LQAVAFVNRNTQAVIIQAGCGAHVRFSDPNALPARKSLRKSTAAIPQESMHLDGDMR
jgi:hypothetical protein